MSKTDYVVSCPYCRRQYRMKLDREEITLKKTRATCGRCGNSFELAPRIAIPGAAAMAPPSPPPARRPTPRGTQVGIGAPSAFAPGELDKMSRDLHDAADQAAQRAAGAPIVDTTRTTMIPSPPPPPAPAAKDEEPRTVDFDSTPATITEAPVAPPLVAPVRAKTWLEQADPGLAGLKAEPTPALRVLDQLL